MDISSIADLDRLESIIHSRLRRIKLGDALNSLYLTQKKYKDIEPFMMAGFALFATRFCKHSKVAQEIKSYDIRYLLDLSNKYFLADPITLDKKLHDEFIKQNPVFMLLRVISSQFPFSPPLFGDFARPFYLYHEIPKQLSKLDNIPKFDFESSSEILQEYQF